MEHPVTSTELVAMAVFLGAGIVVALVARVVLRWLAARAARSETKADDLVVEVLADLVPLAALLCGLWLAVVQLPLTPDARNVVDHVLLALAVAAGTVVAARLAVRGTRAFALRRSGVAPSTSIFANIVRILVLAVGALVVLDTLGISITPLLTALGVGGLAVALALQDTLSNLFAGIHLLASKKIEPGDYIQLSSGEEGYVIDVNWRNTAVRALPDNTILVPNSVLSSQVVTNYHRPFHPMSVLVQVGVSYDSDLEHVERVTIDVATEVMQQVEGGVPDYQPAVRYHTFGESSIDFSVIIRAREFADQYVLKHEFVKRLHRRYRAEGIEIPFPIRTVVTQPAPAG